jgi:IS30 family transposase
MTSIIQEQETRRLQILDGVNKGLTNSKIAENLGVNLWIVTRDLKRMKYDDNSELKQARAKAQERVQDKKLMVANLRDERFKRMTGMTLKEKTFKNMMSFYKPELKKIIESKNECEAIRDLPNSVKKTLRRHKIIVSRARKNVEISAHARSYLKKGPVRE